MYLYSFLLPWVQNRPTTTKYVFKKGHNCPLKGCKNTNKQKNLSTLPSPLYIKSIFFTPPLVYNLGHHIRYIIPISGILRFIIYIVYHLE